LTSIEFGRITKPHGLRGEVKLRLHWEQSDALAAATTLTLVAPDGERRQLELQHARRVDKGYLVKFRGIDDCDGAEALRGHLVELPRAALPQLEPGEFYLCDLVGMSVQVAGAEHGKVVEVMSHPSVDSVIIELSDGRRAEQTLAEPWLVSVDVERGVIELSTADAFII
jgi:16S rRNA processing protein RimM